MRQGSGPRSGARTRSEPSRHKTRTAALVVLAIVAGPVLGYWLTGAIGPAILWLEGPDSAPFWLSIKVAVPATAVAGCAGIGAGYILAKRRFRGRDLLEAVGSVPIILPPTVLGYYLLQILSGHGLPGQILTGLLGHQLVFTVTGCIIAASVAAFPFCMRAARAAIEVVDPRIEDAARVMGLPAWRVALQVTLPLARRGISAGLTLGAVRALGEYGATLMVGGNIPGSTRTMSLAVADAQTTPERHSIVLVLVFMAVGALIVISRLGRTAA